MARNEQPTDSGETPGAEPLSGPPRWVKVSGISAGIVLLIAIAVMLLSGGEHGPARHGSGAAGLGPAPCVAQIEAGYQGAHHHMLQA